MTHKNWKQLFLYDTFPDKNFAALREDVLEVLKIKKRMAQVLSYLAKMTRTNIK